MASLTLVLSVFLILSLDALQGSSAKEIARNKHFHKLLEVKKDIHRGEDAASMRLSIAKKDGDSPCPTDAHDKVTPCYDTGYIYVFTIGYDYEDGKCMKSRDIKEKSRCDTSICPKSYFKAGGCEASNDKPINLYYSVLNGDGSCTVKSKENSRIACDKTYTCPKPKTSIGDCIDGVRQNTAVSYTQDGDKCVFNESPKDKASCSDDICGKDYEIYGKCDGGQQRYVKAYSNIVDGQCKLYEDVRYYSC